jgi:hypothetical protein
MAGGMMKKFVGDVMWCQDVANVRHLNDEVEES